MKNSIENEIIRTKNNSIEYEIIRTKKNIEDLGWVVTFGIMVKSNQCILMIIEDVYCNYKFVSDLVEKISVNNVSVFHLMDIVQDALS